MRLRAWRGCSPSSLSLVFVVHFLSAYRPGLRRMANTARRRSLARWSIGAVTLTVLAACRGDGAQSGNAKPSPKARAAAAAKVASCRRGDTTAFYVAYREFIKVTTPTAQRFLTAAGTDSAAPEDGFRAMQDKGPSYYYGGDSIAQRKVREKLASVGPYASLLIAHRGAVPSAGGDTVVVSLRGHFIGGELNGTAAAGKTMTVACGEAGWKVAKVAASPPQ